MSTWVQQHPDRFLGPTIVAILIQSLEMGVIFNQFARFYSYSWDHERRPVQIMAVFVTVIASVQTGFGFRNAWMFYVVHFGDWIYAVTPQITDDIQPLMIVLMAAPVQSFLIWRCCRLLHAGLRIVAPLILLLVATIILNIVVTENAITYFKRFLDVPLPLEDVGVIKVPIVPEFIAALGLTALLDVLITSVLTIHLWRSRAEVSSRRFRMVLDQILVIMWEAAAPPSCCAFATVIVYIMEVQENNWDLMLQAILGKLYVISLFVTLNSKEYIKRQSVAPDTLQLSALRFSTAPPFGEFSRARTVGGWPDDPEAQASATSPPLFRHRESAWSLADMRRAKSVEVYPTWSRRWEMEPTSAKETLFAPSPYGMRKETPLRSLRDPFILSRQSALSFGLPATADPIMPIPLRWPSSLPLAGVRRENLKGARTPTV